MTENKRIYGKMATSNEGNPTSLRIAIVGAGIGGLTAAVGLRRQGHHVDLYEQSRFATEVGAGIHLAPNANGILRRWGLMAEDFGGNLLERLSEFRYNGTLIRVNNLAAASHQWQNPWHLVHRVALHDSLKKAATQDEGAGCPANLHTSSKVVDVDPERGIITLEDGTTVVAHVIVGADGIYSCTRRFISGKDSKLFSSGKAAFRFLIPREVAEQDPDTRQVFASRNSASMWFADDRRVVVYPINDNEMINFVGIHPESESHETPGDDWSNETSVEQLLKVFERFDPTLLKLLRKADPEKLQVWQLLDMRQLGKWTNQRLTLLGDAAHPFTPHQGQGAAQAIEDAAALAVVLSPDASPADVPERLKLYEKIRYERAHVIQEQSRQVGRDWVDGKPQINIMEFRSWLFAHDAHDHAEKMLKQWLWSKMPHAQWRMPISFGPLPEALSRTTMHSPLGDHQGDFTTASVRFKTSRTYLESLFPTDAYKFEGLASICEATFSVTTRSTKPREQGPEYSRFGFYIHGIEYVKQDGSVVPGTFLPVLMDNQADGVRIGREELGLPSLFCDIEICPGSASYQMKASWRGTTFAELTFEGLIDRPCTDNILRKGTDDLDILVHRYIPKVGEPGQRECAYPVLVKSKQEHQEHDKRLRSGHAAVKLDAVDWVSLPTLHNVVASLARVPILDTISATVVDGTWVSDEVYGRRIE